MKRTFEVNRKTREYSIAVWWPRSLLIEKAN